MVYFSVSLALLYRKVSRLCNMSMECLTGHIVASMRLHKDDENACCSSHFSGRGK